MYDDEVLQEIRSYIDSHLDSEITLKRISDKVCYSEAYVSRFFKSRTGQNLFDYIRSKRLLKAVEQIRSGRCRLLDLAMDSGFSSYEGFSRAFSSYFGMSPVRFRQLRPEVKSFMPRGYKVYPLAYKETRMEKLVIMTQVVERPRRKLLLKRGKQASDYFQYCEEIGCDLWGRLLELAPEMYEPVGMWLPPAFRAPDSSEYIQGVELPEDYDLSVPSDMDCIELPPCRYMIFHSEPYEEDDKIMMDVIMEVQRAIRNYNFGFYGYEQAYEDGPRFQLMPLGERGYIEGVPVRPKG